MYAYIENLVRLHTFRNYSNKPPWKCFLLWEQEFDCTALQGINHISWLDSLTCPPVFCCFEPHLLFFFKVSVTIFVENKCM